AGCSVVGRAKLSVLALVSGSAAFDRRGRAWPNRYHYQPILFSTARHARVAPATATQCSVGYGRSSSGCFALCTRKRSDKCGRRELHTADGQSACWRFVSRDALIRKRHARSLLSDL